MIRMWIVFTILYTSFHNQGIKCAEDEMEEFPLDTDENDSDQTIDISTLDESNNTGAEENGGSGGDPSDKLDLSGLQSSNKIALFNQIMSEAMKKPGAKQRLAQVLPIIRTMSPTQRLTLATLVLKQLKSKSGQQPIMDHFDQYDNKTAELMLPISMDIAAMFNGLKKEGGESGRSTGFSAYYYNPLSVGYRVNGPQRPVLYNVRRFQPTNSRKKDYVPPEMMPPPYVPASNVSYANYKKQPEGSDDGDSEDDENDEEDSNTSASDIHKTQDCDPFINNLCLDVNSYPSKEIVSSIKNLEQKHVFRALIEDFVHNVTTENPDIERRHSTDNKEDNFQICSSKVKYARPRKAKSMNGNWKLIVNTDHYTQTVRIETCLNPDKSCSYLNENVKSHCSQIYNYHRLLTWDEKTGLSLDLFKIPTCCSCQIQHVTPFSSAKYSQKPDSGLQDNVIVDESVHTPVSKPKMKNKLNILYNNPKRDSHGRPRRPHQPILPINYEGGNEFLSPARYSPNDNAIRRTSGKTNIIKGVYIPGKSTFAAESSEQESTMIPRRVNYNYHPIIDFFRSTSSQPIDRADTLEEWSPMTEGPRSLKQK